MIRYQVGDTIQYRTIARKIRTVLVESKDDDVKDGRPGFDGTCVDAGPDAGVGVWGYDADVVRVVRKAGAP